MGLGVINKVMPAGKYKWKAFCETTSTRSDWVIGQFRPNADTEWKAIDKVTGAEIDSGIHPKNKYHLHINLSNNSNGVIIYLKVDKNGNGVDRVWFWSYNHELNWVDIDVLPMLSDFWIGYNSSQYVDVRNARGTNQIANFYVYSSKLKNIDFINNSEAFVILKVYGNMSIVNNQILDVTKWKSSLRYLRFESANVGYDTFNFSDFTNLRYLYFHRDFNLKDVNGTNILLPKDTLKYLRIYKVNVLFPQFGVDTFPLLYSIYLHSIYGQPYDYNKITNAGDKLPALQNMYLYLLHNMANSVLNFSNSSAPIKQLVLYGLLITDLNITNTPHFEFLKIRSCNSLTNISIDQTSQSLMNRLYYTQVYTDIDLSNASNLNNVFYKLKSTNNSHKLNIKNGNNANLTNFDIDQTGADTCYIVDDPNLPIFTNSDHKTGDVFTTDPNDTNCPN